ncbi:unnamed protein product [Calicophoron daubneyi]|uniref:MCMDC2 N-terminal domain-containing protein n=1 Tax=Calicophoron daubneyi TaxID=300641 RepID=A0AAV2T8K5_CALDB
MGEQGSLGSVLIRYLESTNQMEQIKRQIWTRFRIRRRSVCKVCVDLSPHRLIDLCQEFGNVLIYNFKGIENCIREISFAVGEEIGVLRDDDDVGCISVKLKLLDRLCLSELEVGNSNFISGRLTTCSGTVMALSNVEPHARVLTYSCPDACCPGAAEFRAIERTPSLSEKKNITCIYCGSKLKEEIQKRSLTEKVEFMLLLDSTEKIQLYHIDRGTKQILNRQIICVISDELIDLLYLGMHCYLTGVPYRQSLGRTVRWVFEVNSLEGETSRSMDPWKFAVTSVIHRFPPYVHEYAFGVGFTLAYTFLDYVSPPGTYLLLKWLLLLLLIQDQQTKNKVQASCLIEPERTENSGPGLTALLVLGPPSCPMANRLLRAAAHYARSCWEHRPGGQLLPTALELDASGQKRPQGTLLTFRGTKRGRKSRDWKKSNPCIPKFEIAGYNDGRSMVHSGTLELAAGGVAFFPDIELLKKKEVINLTYALENVRLSSLSTRTAGSEGQPSKEGLSSTACGSIWATSGIYPRKLRTDTQNVDFADLDSVGTASPIVETLPRRSVLHRALCAFDLIVDADIAVGPSEVTDELMADFCLDIISNCDEKYNEEVTGKTSSKGIYEGLLADFNKSPPAEVSKEASDLLKVYYLAVRRACTTDRFSVPSSALGILFKLAASNAKLNGRTLVGSADATVAVYIYDTFVPNRTGTTYLGARPLHYSKGMDEQSVNEVNEILQSVYAQLKGLIDAGFNEE